jgi:hypothetical protein
VPLQLSQQKDGVGGRQRAIKKKGEDILLPSKHFEIYFPRTMKSNAKVG